MKKILLWFRIVRPQTLPASLCPVVIGLACSPVTVHWPVAWATILCALGLQILSNLINDYYDFRRGTDRKARVGFRRALAEGEVSERQMLIAIDICLTITLALGFALILCGLCMALYRHFALAFLSRHSRYIRLALLRRHRRDGYDLAADSDGT